MRAIEDRELAVESGQAPVAYAVEGVGFGGRGGSFTECAHVLCPISARNVFCVECADARGLIEPLDDAQRACGLNGRIDPDRIPAAGAAIAIDVRSWASSGAAVGVSDAPSIVGQFSDHCLDARREGVDAGAQSPDPGQGHSRRLGVVIIDAPALRGHNLRVLVPYTPARESRRPVRVAPRGDQGLDHVPGQERVQFESHRRHLDERALEQLFQPPVTGAFVAQVLAQPAQPPDRVRGHERQSRPAVLRQLGSPDSVGSILLGLAALVAAFVLGVVALMGSASAHADAVAYLVNVTLRPGYNFPNADAALTYGRGICDKVEQGRPYAEIVKDIWADFNVNDGYQASYLISQAVNELCPALIWPLRNSAAHYRPTATP